MTFYSICVGILVLAAVLDILANLLLARSNGFKSLKYGGAALILVCLAYVLLSVSLRGIDLSIAYAMWGGFGIAGTMLGGWLLFGQKPKLYAWGGLVLLACGITVLQYA